MINQKGQLTSLNVTAQRQRGAFQPEVILRGRVVTPLQRLPLNRCYWTPDRTSSTAKNGPESDSPCEKYYPLPVVKGGQSVAGGVTKGKISVHLSRQGAITLTSADVDLFTVL